MFRDDVAAHELFNSRLRFYRMCDLTVEIREEETPGEIAERIILELPKPFLESKRRMRRVP